MSVLYKADPERGRVWAALFAEHAPGLAFHIWPETGDLADVEYMVAWEPPPELLNNLPNLRILFSSGAGIDHLDLSSIPEQLPVVRMIEPGIIDGMVEYATMSVLALHRNLLDYFGQQAAGQWKPIKLVPAVNRRVGVMGMGVLGQAVLNRLGSFGFALSGWNRSHKELPRVTTYVGLATLDSFLGQCDILICLLPLTDETKGILNQQRLAALPRGAALINPGRGAHVDQQALLEALDSAHLSAAILDVSVPEPLPASHPFWSHPRILMTPHIASMTRPESAALIVLDNIERLRNGEQLLGLIDRSKGY